VSLEFLAIEGSQSAESSVNCDVVGRQELGKVAVVNVGLKEVASGALVLASAEFSQARRTS
jgi:hypothetical protein